MNKRQKEVLQSALEDEKAVFKLLEKNYTAALADVKRNIRELQANPLTQSKAYQLEFQKQLEKQISGILDNLQGKNFTSIAEYLNSSYRNSFLGNMYDMQGQGVPLVIPIDEQQVLKSVQKTGDDFKLSTKLGGNTKKLKEQVQQELVRGFATELTYAQIARNISDYGEADMHRSMTIARTEGHRVQNEARWDSMTAAKKKGADIVKQWDATFDSSTRPEHAELDGQVVELDEDFKVGSYSAPYPGAFGDPYMDCNCRCAMLQRARWAVKDETTYQKWNNETGGFIECSGFEDFKDKYLKAAEKLKTSQNSGIIKDYNSELAQKFGKDHYEAMHRLIDGCSDADLAAVWEKYESQIRVGNARYSGHEYCSGSSIYVNGARDAQGSTWQSPYQVSFHESGHAIDYLARSQGDSTSIFARHYSSAYKNGIFPDTIKSEVADWVSEVDKRLKAEFKAHEDDFEWLHSHGYISDWNWDFFKRNGTWIGGKPKYSKSYAYKAIEKEIRQLDPKAKADLSDILEGATVGKISVGFGHGASYWKQRKMGGVDDGLATEAFAEMVDSSFSCPESLESIKKYLPKSYGVFQEMIQALLKKG